MLIDYDMCKKKFKRRDFELFYHRKTHNLTIFGTGFVYMGIVKFLEYLINKLKN